MYVRKKQISTLNNLFSGIGIISLGVIVIIDITKMYMNFINFIGWIFVIYGVSKLFNFILTKKIVRNRQILISIILNILFGFIVILFPKIPISILPLIFSLYLLFNAIVKFLDYMVLKENNLSLRYKSLFFCLIFFFISLSFLFYPLNKISLFILIMGIYCLILGLNKIYEFLIDLLSDKFKIKIKHKLKITLPVFFEAFIPKKALKKIDKYVNSILDSNVKNEESDLQIFIHLSNYGFNQFGHIDFCFNNKVYSYGNYDYKSRKILSVFGDGVLFELSDKNRYIEFCVKKSKKTIVEYGIRLTNKQKEILKNEINILLEQVYEWNHDILKKDYTYKLCEYTNCKFYKFKSGIFKTYFVAGTNCTYFVNEIFIKSLHEFLKLAGIITPGTYYYFLDENYNKKNNKVISKKIYTKEMFGDVYVKNKK